MHTHSLYFSVFTITSLSDGTPVFSSAGTNRAAMAHPSNTLRSKMDDHHIQTKG